MNRSKRYAENSRLLFFREAFGWIVNNIIVINPSIGMLNAAVYYDNGSLERVCRLIETFDTGVTDIKERLISLEEMNRLVSAEVVQTIFAQLKAQMQMSDLSTIQTTWRAEGGFFNICIRGNLEPEISTIVLRHAGSSFDFSFADESDGTKRLFDLVDMLLKGRSDTVFVVDELERSLHPKLTKHFLRLFMRAHDGDRTQLVFTTHEDAIMDQSLFFRIETRSGSSNEAKTMPATYIPWTASRSGMTGSWVRHTLREGMARSLCFGSSLLTVGSRRCRSTHKYATVRIWHRKARIPVPSIRSPKEGTLSRQSGHQL